MKLKIKQSNFSKAEKLLETFKLVCVSFCEKNKEIKKKLKSLSPDN
jgi:16S rRNA A1518/A1519 N6-dimethyltransferase RsmA/KsgA/DIM1 with predicted DNA glycosylase/AP lyase activity